MQAVLDRLSRLAEVTAGRVPMELMSRGDEVIARADQRLRLGQETVVALAGATGSGKSSLTNALARAAIATVGVRRPTTSQTLSISFAPENTALLDWLRVPRRYEVKPPQEGLERLVLLDLPDHDSTAKPHRAEVDRLIPVVDQFVWVLDPQKYADVVVHRQYLQPLAPHRDVIAVALNQADRLRPNEVRDCLAHLEELLRVDGLTGVPMFAVSAATGEGIDELRRHLAGVVARKTAARKRLLTDVDLLAADYESACSGQTGGIPEKALQEGLEAAAGVPQVVSAVSTAFKRRGSLVTGWPMVSWLGGPLPGAPRRRPHPEQGSPQPTSPQIRSSVAQAQLDLALRALADEAGKGLSPGWRQAIAEACRRDRELLPGLLEEAVATADLDTQWEPLWWRLVRVLQWLLLTFVGVGALWLAVNLILTYLGLPPLLGPGIGPGGHVAIPTVLVLGGVVAGVGLSLASSFLISAGVRGALRRARKALSRAIAEVGEEHILTPLRVELDRLEQARHLVRDLRR